MIQSFIPLYALMALLVPVQFRMTKPLKAVNRGKLLPLPGSARTFLKQRYSRKGSFSGSACGLLVVGSIGRAPFEGSATSKTTGPLFVYAPTHPPVGRDVACVSLLGFCYEPVDLPDVLGALDALRDRRPILVRRRGLGHRDISSDRGLQGSRRRGAAATGAFPPRSSLAHPADRDALRISLPPEGAAPVPEEAKPVRREPLPSRVPDDRRILRSSLNVMKQYWIEHLVSWIVDTYIGLLRSVVDGFRDPVSFTNVLVDLVHVAELAVVLLAGFAAIVYLAHTVIWAVQKAHELALELRDEAAWTWRRIAGRKAKEADKIPKEEGRKEWETLDDFLKQFAGQPSGTRSSFKSNSRN